MDSKTVVEIAEYHNDVVDSLKLYFSEISPSFGTRFFGRSSVEIVDELAARIEETDRRSAFFILGALEAAFKVDYLHRCQKKTKGDVSDAFRLIYRDQKQNARLDDIFRIWREKSPAPRPRLISELRGAFKFRHWLAHGRYWEPSLGRKKYDFNFIYSLADDVLKNFKFVSPD